MSDAPSSAPAEQTIDLDAARAARAEARRKAGKVGPPVVRLLGQEWPLPAELPAETAHAFGALAAGDYSALGPGMEALFGDSWEKLHQAAKDSGEPLSLEDEAFLLEEAMDRYGMTLPESPASAPS